MRYYNFTLSFFVGFSLLAQAGFAQTPGTQKWAFTMGSSVSSSPAIGAGGTIYVGSNDEKIYAINPDGTQKWSFTVGGWITSSPAIGADGTIYVGSHDTKLYAINPDGTQKWAYTTGSTIWSSPAIAEDGTIYVGSNDRRLHAVNANGTLKWSYSTGGEIYSSPAISKEGTIHFGSWDYKIYALNPDGTKKWTFDTGGRISSAPALDADNTVYIGSFDQKLYAINPDGTQKWAYFVGEDIRSAPLTIGSDGTIYLGSYANSLFAIALDGTKKWSFSTGSGIGSYPAIGVDGTIYVGSSSKKIYAIDPNGTQKWAFTTGGVVGSSAAIGTDGTLYVGSGDNKLYALYSGSAGLASSPWPKFHQNNQNTGLAGSTTSLAISDQFQFRFFTRGEIFQKIFEVSNLTAKAVTLKSYTFDHSAFSLINPMPMTLPAGSKSTLTAAIHTDSSRLYQSNCQLTYEVEGQTQTSSGQISAGLFREDDSERAYMAHHALDAYNACKAKDPSSVATQNNLGVLYRLLSEPVIAEQNFFTAVNKALNAKYGYSGIKMNIGVTKSDQGQAGGANEYYNYALGEVSASASTSSLAPQLYYNKAWEAYAGNNLAEATTQANQTIVHNQANNCLKAKAYILRGAVYFRQSNVSAARSDFQQAITLSADCPPIRRMAEENLLITSVDDRDGENVPRVFVLMPNYPNPFNPETVISFGLPKNGKMELLIYNVLGQKVRTVFAGHKPAGWHNVTWDGTDDNGNQVGSGVYLLQMKTDGFESIRKMTLLR